MAKKKEDNENFKRLIAYLNRPKEDFDPVLVGNDLYMRRGQILLGEFGKHLRGINLLVEMGAEDTAVKAETFWDNLQEMKYHLNLEKKPREYEAKVRKLSATGTITIPGSAIGLETGDTYSIIPERGRILVMPGDGLQTHSESSQ